MKIYAFQGFRYSSSLADPGRLAAPPFDQIDDDLRDRLHAQSRYQFAQVTRPVENDDGAHLRARQVHDDWLREGAIVRDQEPALYPYSIETARDRRRLGLGCLVGVGASCEGDLRPHEETVDKPLADRLALLEATRIDFEPVLYIAEDDGRLEEKLSEDCAEGQETVSHTDPLTGDRHILYRVGDRQRVAAYRRLLESRHAVIADGHHRTKVAQLFARRHKVAEGEAACAKFAVLTSVTSPDLQIDPIHRAMAMHVDDDALSSKAVRREPFSGSGGRDLAAAVAAAPQPAIGVWLGGKRPEVWTLDPHDLPPDTPGAAAGLPVVLLHYQLLAAAGFTPENARDGSVLYRADPDELYRSIEAGQVKAGFWLPPMEPQAFAVATAGGDVLPPKSTRFLPKLVSGLVWCGHDAEII